MKRQICQYTSLFFFGEEQGLRTSSARVRLCVLITSERMAEAGSGELSMSWLVSRLAATRSWTEDGYRKGAPGPELNDSERLVELSGRKCKHSLIFII